MIVKAGASLRGSRVRGLLTYLLGPGRHTEHVDPRVVGAWTPVELLPGRDHGANDALGLLARALEAPVRAVAPMFRPAKHVWHCIVQNDRRIDPVLSDDQWASIAERLIDAAGLENCRWVAVRHADHGIHIAATLVDENGNRAALRNEIRNLNRCRVQLEAKYCRRRTDPGTRTGGINYQRHEYEKARRDGARQPVRVRLRNAISAAALQASSTDEFAEALKSRGVLVGFRYSTLNPDEVTGYKVALATDTNRQGDPVWYKASAIDRSLTWPKISARIRGASTVKGERSASAQANAFVARARIARHALESSGRSVDDLGSALADAVTALNLHRPPGLDDTQWNALLDRAFWLGRRPGGIQRNPPTRTSRGLLAAAHVIAAQPLTDRASWLAITREISGAVNALSRAHRLTQRRRQAEHAAEVASALEAAVRRIERSSEDPARCPDHARTALINQQMERNRR